MYIKLRGLHFSCGLMMVMGTCGCTEIATRYSVSGDNVGTLRSVLASRIDVAAFSQEPNVKLTNIQCASMKVSPPDGQSFSDYIRSTFVSELKVADRFTSDSENKISGKLTALRLEASPLSLLGKWVISVTVSNGLIGAQILEEYGFRYSGTMTACQAAAANFPAAVQSLVGKLIASPVVIDTHDGR